MSPALYTELVPWYRLLDPPEDHEDEAVAFTRAFENAATFRPWTMLELGAGAGHNGVHLKRRFDCTLTDLSPDMQRLSRELNPECAHALGDMRTLRLGKAFDVVLVHDAICYMTTQTDLRAVVATAFEHTQAGGAAIFAPDHVRETFSEHCELYQVDEAGTARSLRCVEWTWDPDPGDTTYAVEYAFLLRDGTTMRAVHDPHVEGLFSRETWIAVLSDAGYRVSTFPRPLGDGEFDESFVCARPG